MTHNYQDTHIKTCEKLLRQRVHYITLAKSWEAEANAPSVSPTDEDVLRAKVELMMKVAADLQFITDRAMRGLPVADIEEIQNLSRRTPLLRVA